LIILTVNISESVESRSSALTDAQETRFPQCFAKSKFRNNKPQAVPLAAVEQSGIFLTEHQAGHFEINWVVMAQ